MELIPPAYDKSFDGYYHPTLYPGEKDDTWEVPTEIKSDFHKLNSIIEGKYSKEYLKICAFYNKMFPSLKQSAWSKSAYNSRPFTVIDQERNDTGNGISSNYLKQIIDQVTSRLGTITFIPSLISEEQSLEYIVYKDEVERLLRMYIRNDEFNEICLEAFHDASILCYSHVFIDPYTGKLRKANDYEVGMFESQFNNNHVVQMLYRDYDFPTSDALVYLVDCDDKEKEEMLEQLANKNSVDLKMYFNCPEHKVYVTINNKTLPAKDYPFDEVLMSTFKWDVGVNNTTATSLFDLLYPCQREINRINAKVQQLIRLYKGPVPVFNSNVDLSMKSITNGSGECLYVDSVRPVDSLATVINPTPLDPQLSAEITNYKTMMYELAGLQNMSFDMENMRSAAAVVALDQTRDAVFQAQLSGMARFIKQALKLYIDYFAYSGVVNPDRRPIDWKAISTLVDQSYINLQPVHLTDPQSDENAAKQEEVDYVQLQTARTTLDIIRGKTTWETMPYYIDPNQITMVIAMTLVKFDALGIPIPDTIHIYLINAFLEEVKNGNVVL